jgi:hypothetical protein
MRFIDELDAENEREGNSIFNEFIEVQWDAFSQRYINLNYTSFVKSKMVKLIRKEQSDFCCYCMRSLTDKNITLEHIISNNIRTKPNYQADVAKYLLFAVLRNNVSLWDDQNFMQIQITPPFPHFIAYQNLVASCNGELIDKNGHKLERHQCCNNRRESDFIIPFFFIPNISQIITYSKDGDIICDEEFVETFRCLNLADGTLKLLRNAWYFLGRNVSETEIEASKNDLEKRFEILDEAEMDQKIKNTLLSDIYWNLFCEYKWFHSYYRSN